MLPSICLSAATELVVLCLIKLENRTAKKTLKYFTKVGEKVEWLSLKSKLPKKNLSKVV